ncbi:hypothetical protein WJX79_002199 [Trebouxia sp. C0005]
MSCDNTAATVTRSKPVHSNCRLATGLACIKIFRPVGEEHLGEAVEAKKHVVKLMEETLYEKAKSLEEYLSVDTLDERMKDITQDMCGSVRNRPCTRPSSTKSSQVLADKGDDSESGLMTQSDTEMRCQTDPENTQIGSQTDSGHPESLSHTSSKHSRCSDHAHDEVTSHMRGTATAICVQSAPPLPWSEVIALGYIPEDWLSPKLLRREQIVNICGRTCLPVTLLTVTPGASVASSW